MTPAEIQGWLAEVVRPLVSAPEAVTITEVGRSNGTLLLEVRAAEVDLGRIIGHEGATLKAIRQLVHAVGGRHHLRVLLDVPGTHSGSRQGDP